MSRIQSGNRPYPTLKAWRASKGFTTMQAAEFLNISEPVYSRLERGVRYLKGPRAKHVMDKTHVPLEVIVGVA